jgi:hypothetical protein
VGGIEVVFILPAFAIQQAPAAFNSSDGGKKLICGFGSRYAIPSPTQRRRKVPCSRWHRHERKTPGELLHLDTKKLARFDRPGKAATCSKCRKDLQFIHPASRVKSLSPCLH